MIRPTAATLGTVVLAGGAAVAAFNLPSSISNDAGTAASTTSAINRRDFVAKSASAAVAAAAVLPGSAVADDAADPYADYVTSESGMRYLITKEGDGAVPSAGQTVKVRSMFFTMRINLYLLTHNTTTRMLAWKDFVNYPNISQFSISSLPRDRFRRFVESPPLLPPFPPIRTAGRCTSRKKNELNRRTTPAGSTGSIRLKSSTAPAIAGVRSSSRSAPVRSFGDGTRPSAP